MRKRYGWALLGAGLLSGCVSTGFNSQDVTARGHREPIQVTDGILHGREAQQREWSSLAAIHEWTAPPQARGGEHSQAEPENVGERRTSDGDGERTDRRGRRDAEEARRKIRGKEAANERSDGPQIRGIEERRRRHPGPHPAEDERGADRAAEGHALHPAPP